MGLVLLPAARPPKGRTISAIPKPATPAEPLRPQPSPVGSFLLLAAAAVLYAPYLAALVAAPPWTEPGQASGEELWGEAWAELFASVFGGALWLALAALLYLAGRKGHAPPAWRAASAILFVCAAAATLVAARTYVTWPGGGSIFVAALPQPLVMFYGVAVRLKTFAAGALRFAPAAALVAIALVASSSIVFAYLDPIGYPARLAEERRRSAADIARRNAESESKAVRWEQDIAKLGPDSSLAAWLDYVNGSVADTALREKAVAGARQAKRRQAEAVALLDSGRVNRLVEMWRFDLAATPELCASYDHALQKIAASDDDIEMVIGERLKSQISNIKFLLANHCDLSAGLSAAETRAKKVAAALPGDEEWARFPEALAGLRGGR